MVRPVSPPSAALMFWEARPWIAWSGFFLVFGMENSVFRLKQLIRAHEDWRDELIAKKSGGYVAIGSGKSIDDLIADADAQIQNFQQMIDSITHMAKSGS